MKLTEVYKVLKFEQSGWLKKCINFNKKREKKLLIVLKKVFLS